MCCNFCDFISSVFSLKLVISELPVLLFWQQSCLSLPFKTLWQWWLFRWLVFKCPSSLSPWRRCISNSKLCRQLLKTPCLSLFCCSFLIPVLLYNATNCNSAIYHPYILLRLVHLFFEKFLSDVVGNYFRCYLGLCYSWFSFARCLKAKNVSAQTILNLILSHFETTRP